MIAADVMEPKLGRALVVGFCIIAFSITILILGGDTQALTGDEPRYLMYAYSILKNGRFVMTLPEWHHLYLSVTGSPTSFLPSGAGGIVLLNSVYLPTLLAPVAYFFALSGLRAVTLISGVIGMFYLLRLCRRFASPSASLLATGIAGFSIPLLPYLHLFYMETFLFALVCCVWDRLQKEDRGTTGDLITATIILAIPFVHMRGSVVAAVFYVALLWQQYVRRRRGHVVALVALGAAAFAIFVAMNLAIYGVITGPVNTGRPPLPSQLFSVLSMQSFNVHHGLFAYAPVWMLGYAGLWGGSMRRIPTARQGLVLAAIAAVTGVGIMPGECWPARYWVLSIPMLAVGLCVFWELGRSVLLRAIAVFLIGATLVNSVIFFRAPNAFLENRQSTATYQRLFDTVGHFNFGLMLPVGGDDAVDVDAARNLARAVDVDAARNLAIGAAAIILLLTLALASRRSIYATPVVLLLLATLDLSRVSIVPPREYTVQRTANGFSVAFHAPISVSYVQFGAYWQAWFTPPDWQRFAMVVSGTDAQQFRELRFANQVISASCSSGIQSISVEGPPVFDFSSQIQARFIVYRSRSLLRDCFSWFRKPC